MTATQLTAKKLIDLISKARELNKAKTLNSILMYKNIDMSYRGLRQKGYSESKVYTKVDEMEKYVIAENVTYVTVQFCEDEFFKAIETDTPPPPRPHRETPPQTEKTKVTINTTSEDLENAAEKVKSDIINMLKNFAPSKGADMDEIKKMFEYLEESVNDRFFNMYDDLSEKIKSAKGETEKIYITPNVPEGTKVGKTHKQYQTLLKMVIAGKTVDRYVWITGGAGGGKTHAAKQVADALGVQFKSMSVSAQMTQSALIGYPNANGNYVSTSFRDCYENGGLFCLDEIDNGNSNILSALNSALANGFCAFPDGQIEMNKDFYLIATANTTGNGATKAYVGRNQIGADTKDRFIFLDWQYDEEIEKAICGNDMIAFNRVKELRSAANKHNLTCVISPRATASIAALIRVGFTLNEAVNFAITEKLTPQEKTALNL